MLTADAPITLPDNPLLTRDEILAALRISPRDIERLVSRGQFPAPTIRLTPHLSRWDRATVVAFLASRGASA